jgi:glycosyltransferase involved in cell wall biosynthesis
LKKNFLFIAREFTDGGAALLLARHLNRLSHEEYDIYVLITGDYSRSLLQTLPNQVRIHTSDGLRLPKKPTVLSIRMAMESAHSALWSHEFDCVVATSIFADMPACCAYALSKAKRKILILLDEGLISKDPESQQAAAMRNAIIASDHLVPVSHGLLKTLQKHYPILEQIPYTVVFPPVDEQVTSSLNPFDRNQSDDLLNVVTAARLSPEKQIHHSLFVQKRLRDAGIDFHWYVLGEGNLRKDLERKVRKLGMSDRFHLMGFKENPRDWMQHADLFVLNSKSEGCPTVLIESLIEGTTVVSTDVNGARELIRDGETGVICSDSEDSLFNVLAELVTNHSYRNRLKNQVQITPGFNVGNETTTLLAIMDGIKRNRTPPEVTILIPTFNQEYFIAKTIHSALMQDYDHIEVIVCDDASDDNTSRIAQTYLSDPRFKYIKREKRLGRVANYRMGLEIDASGKWVIMLDGDDYLIDPSFIRKAMQALKDHAYLNPMFIQAGQRVIRQSTKDATHSFKDYIDLLPHTKEDISVMNGQEYISFVYKTSFFSHLGTLYSRENALKIGFYTKDISSSDMDSLLRLALEGNVLILKTIAGAWVQHGKNTSSNLPLSNIFENVSIFREIANEGILRGKLQIASLNKSLMHYESMTLKHLFAASVGKSAKNPLHAGQMLLIILRINPKLLLEVKLVKAWVRMTIALVKLTGKKIILRLNQLIKMERGYR